MPTVDGQHHQAGDEVCRRSGVARRLPGFPARSARSRRRMRPGRAAGFVRPHLRGCGDPRVVQDAGVVVEHLGVRIAPQAGRPCGYGSPSRTCRPALAPTTSTWRSSGGQLTCRVPVGAIGCGDQWAGIHDEHLVAPESLGQHLVGLCRAAPGSRSADGGEGQPAARCHRQLRGRA